MTGKGCQDTVKPRVVSKVVVADNLGETAVSNLPTSRVYFWKYIFEKVDLGKYTFEKIHLLKDLVCDLGKAAVSNLPTMARYLSTIFPPPAEHFYFHQTFVEAIAEKVRVFRLQSIMIRQICKLFVQAWEDLRQRGELVKEGF